MISDLRHRGRRQNPPFSLFVLPPSSLNHKKSESDESNNENNTTTATNNNTTSHDTKRRGQKNTSICSEAYKFQHNPPQQYHFSSSNHFIHHSSHQQKYQRSAAGILRIKHCNINKICIYMITCSICILLLNSTYSNGYGMVLQEDQDDTGDFEIQFLHDDDNDNTNTIIIKLQIPYLEFGNNDYDTNSGHTRGQFVKPIGDIIDGDDASDHVDNDELENDDNNNYYYSTEEHEEGEEHEETVQNHDTSEHDEAYDNYDHDSSSEEKYYESQEQKQENNDYYNKEYEYYDENQSLEEEGDMKSNDYDDDYINYADDTLRNYFAFDDDNIRHKQCKRTSWHRHHKPSCNMFHELDLIDVDNPMYYLASGAYRDAFRISLSGKDNVSGEGEHFVLKKGSQKKEYE